MKCPNPDCNKTIENNSNKTDQLMYCPHCSTRLSTTFDIIEFLDNNVNLFMIYGVFAAIAVILPTFSQFSNIFLNNSTQSTSIFYAPPYEMQIQFLNFLVKMFVLGCGMMIMLISTFIEVNLFDNSIRNRELILSEPRNWTIRTNDFARYIFLIPFALTSLTLVLYIVMMSGSYFLFYMVTFLIFFMVIFYFIHRDSPMLFKKS